MTTRMILRKAIALAVAVAMLDSSEALKWQKRDPDAPNSVTSFPIGAHAAVLGTAVRTAGGMRAKARRVVPIDRGLHNPARGIRQSSAPA